MNDGAGSLYFPGAILKKLKQAKVDTKMNIIRHAMSVKAPAS